MIRTSYDPEADAMFVWFGPEGVKSVETQEVAPGIMLDLDGERRVIGIEVLDVSERMIRGEGRSLTPAKMMGPAGQVVSFLAEARRYELALVMGERRGPRVR